MSVPAEYRIIWISKRERRPEKQRRTDRENGCMQDFVAVTGMVIKTIPVGEYDRSVTILTKERG